MSDLTKLREWANAPRTSGHFYKVIDRWKEEGAKVITDYTNEYAEDTLYRLELTKTTSQLNGCLIYCSKGYKGRVNWSSYSKVGNLACEVYTRNKDSKSDRFYCILDKDLVNEAGGRVSTGSLLINKIYGNKSLMEDAFGIHKLGDVVVISATDEGNEGGNLYLREEEGWTYLGNINNRQTFIIRKFYESRAMMEEDIGNEEINYYDFVVAREEDTPNCKDYILYQKLYDTDPEGHLTPVFTSVGNMNNCFFIAEAEDAKVRAELAMDKAQEAQGNAESSEEGAREAEEGAISARKYIEQMADFTKDEILDALGISLDELKATIKTEILESQKVSVMMPTIDPNTGTISWRLVTYNNAEEAEANAHKVDEGFKSHFDDIQEIKEQMDSKFGDARVTDDYELYFYANASDSDSEDICGPITGIGGAGGGAGGGGTGGNNAVLSVSNKTGWATATIADGSHCYIVFSWSSIEEGFSTGPGALSIKVGGVTYVASAPIQNGATITRDISSYLTAGQKNKVVVEVSDCYGNKKTLRFTVQVVALKVASTFDPFEPQTQGFDFRCTPTGDASKVMHYVLDGDYGQITARLNNLNSAYKQVGKLPKAEEGVTYYTRDEETGSYVEYPYAEVGETLMAGFYIQDPITYTPCGEGAVAEKDVQYYELVEGEYRALERVVIGSPVDEYYTRDEITYTLLEEQDSIAEEGVIYYDLVDNTVGDTTTSYYVKKEVTVGETVVNDCYVCLYEYGGEELCHYEVSTNEHGVIVQDGYYTTSNGTTLTQAVAEQTHGAHTLDVWFESEIEGAKAPSNLLHYEFAFVVEGETTPILITQYVGSEIEQYETIQIPYKVITPNLEDTPLLKVYVNDLVEEGQERYDDSTKFMELYNVPRSVQNFSYRADKIVEIGSGEDTIREDGWVKVRFQVGADLLVRDFHIVVTPCSIVVEAVKENLDFYLTSNCGKTNNASGFNDWSYNGISAQFSGFTWTSDGWQHDSQGYPVMRLLAESRIHIPFMPFEVDFGSRGETIEIEFSTSNIYNYDTPIISCWDESSQRGFKVTSQKFIFKTQLHQISTQFKEDEHVRVSFTIDEKRGNRIIGCYLNGVMSGAIQYSASNDFSQTIPQGITIGCDDATVDIYNIRFYSRGLTRDEVVTNWIADTFDGYQRKVRYEHNDIYDNGRITPDTLPVDLPYMILSPIDGVSTFDQGSPQFKGDTRQIHGEFHNVQHPEFSFEYNARIDVQGSSSQFYPRKNYEIRMKKATTPYVKYFEKTEPEAKPLYKLTENSVPTERFTFKADYASSEGANNVELTKYYNDLQRNVVGFKTPRQESAESTGDTKDYRIGIDGYPMAVFWQVGNDITFIGKYNFNNSKGTPEVYGFDFYEDDNNPTGYPIESWETLNNVSNRVIWKSDDYDGDAWANDFEARYMDEIPSYKPTQDTTPVEGKQYYYKDSTTKLYVKFGYAWSTVLHKFTVQGSTTPTASDMPNLFEALMDKDEQAVEVNTNTTALRRLATWVKSTDTGYILNTAMKPTTTPSYAVTMSFREKTVADGANVCGLYVEDVDRMELVGQHHPVMDDPTALYARYDEDTGTFKPVDVELGEDVTGLYLISGTEYLIQSATDSLAVSGETYYELVEDEYVEVEDIEEGVTVVNDYYIGYVGTHEKQIILDAMATKEDGVTYYEAYDFHGETFSSPITLTYPTYAWSSKNDGTYDKSFVTDTFSEDNVEYRQAKFKTEFEDYFQKETTLFYYLFTELFLMVDSRAKNAFPTTWDGQHWSWVPYDMDTAIGINNEGALEFGYDLEDYMYIGPDGEGIVIPTPSSANVFNGAESVIWRNVRDCFPEEVAMLYGTLRSGATVGEGSNAKNFVLSYEEIERRFEEHQMKWPERLVNEDSFFKYIEPLLYEAQDYLEMLQGLKAEQRKWWLYNRFNYMDSKYFAGSAKENTILFRAYNKGTFTVVPYTDIYAKGRFGNYIASARAPRNVPTTPVIGLDIVNDLESAIYSADQLKSVGDLSTFNLGYCNISKATRLQELKVGGGVDNTNFNSLTLGNNTLLRKIIATHLPNLQTSVNASNCTSLEEVYFEASGISEIQLPDGGILKTLHLPDTITRLEIQNQTHITDFEVSSVSNNANVYRNISALLINNVSPVVYGELDDMISQMAPLSRVRLLNTPLHFEGQTASECWEGFEAFVESLSGMRGMDASGNTTDKAVVTGDVLLDRVVPSTFFTFADENNKYITMTDEGAQETAYVGLGEYNNYRFKYKEANDTVNWDYNNGSALETHTDIYHTWVGEESDWQKTPISAITPTTDAPSIEVPTRTSTSNHVEEGDVVDYAFEYAGWTREVVEGNVNGGNTYIVRGEEDVIEAENGESYSIIKDETFTAVYKAHPIYYVNFYDRAQRSTGAETGDNDARLAVEEGTLTQYTPSGWFDYFDVGANMHVNLFRLELSEVYFEDGTQPPSGDVHLSNVYYEVNHSRSPVTRYSIGGVTYVMVPITTGGTWYYNSNALYMLGTPTYEKSYVDGTYTEERLGEVPSIIVPLTDPTDWRTNFNDNTIGQDEFERTQDYQYYFKGWTRNANTTIYNYGEDTPEDFFADGEALTVEGNTNFYAVYEKHAIYYADFYDVVGDTGNKLLYTTCMIDGVDGESIGTYGGVTALTKAYNDHNHEHGDSTFGYTYYFDGFKEGKEKFIYDLHEGRVESEAEGTRTATLDIDGTVGVIHENKKFYTVYEARQTYYIAFFNDGVFMHEDSNVLGFESYTYTGSGTRTSVDNSHVRGDAQFGYNFYHRGWNDHNSDLTYDLTLTGDTTVDGRPVRSTACNEFTTTFSNLDGNRNFYEVYEAKQVYYLNFKSWNGEEFMGDEKSFEIGSLGNDSGIPTTRAPFGTHVVDDDNSTYTFTFGGWSLTAVDSEDELTNNHTVAWPTTVTGYDYASGATNIVLNGNTFLYGMYQSHKTYYVSFHDHEGNLLSGVSELQVDDGIGITWNGDASALARATTNNHATDSSAVDYQYEFVGWNDGTSEEVATELNPTYSGSSVTYSAPSYYMHNVIGANTTSNIKLYATYQKRPIYYVNFYDWDNSAVETLADTITVNWGGETVTYHNGDPLYVPISFLRQGFGNGELLTLAQAQANAPSETPASGYVGAFDYYSNSYIYVYKLPEELGEYLYDKATKWYRTNNGDYGHLAGIKDAERYNYKGIAIYPDRITCTSTSGIDTPSFQWSYNWGVGIRKKEDIWCNGYTSNTRTTMSTEWKASCESQPLYQKLEDDAYYMVVQGSSQYNYNDIPWEVNHHFNVEGEEIYFRAWENQPDSPLTTDTDLTSKNTTLRVNRNCAPKHVFNFTGSVREYMYLEGGNTSTTSFDATSASANGSCVYTRTDIPMASATLSRANTEHHSLSDTSANDYNYTYYGWDTAIRGTGDDASAYRSESMASTVKAKTGTLGFVSANTNFYAVYEQKNIYYVGFYNTATPNYQPLTVDWGTGTGGVVTYNAGEGLYIPKEFLQSGFNSSSCQPNADVLDGEVGYQTWFSSKDYRGTERPSSPETYYICVYKLPQNIGEYLYNNAETNTTAFYGEDDTATSGKKLWKGIAIYPDTCSSWSYVGGWGVGIRKKNEIKYIGRDSLNTLTPTSVVESGDYANLENFSQWKALEDDAYYLVAQGNVKSGNLYAMTKWLSYFGNNRIYFRHWATYTQAPTSDTSTHGAKYTYIEPVAPFCAKGYVEGTSASSLTSTTNVVRTLGTTTAPTKASEELFNYTYQGWSTESNDCIYDHLDTDTNKTWEYSADGTIGTMSDNRSLYATFRKEKRVFLDLFNLGTQVGTRQEITTSVTAPSESLLSREQSILHEAGNGLIDSTYIFMGWNSARGTNDEWSDTGMIAKASLTGSLVQAGATANTIGGILASGYDDSTHVVTLHAMWKGEKVFYLDFYEAKVTNGTPVYPTSATVNDFNYRGSISFNKDKTILSGEAPVLNAPSSDMYADYTSESNYSTGSASNVTLEQIMAECIPFQGSVDVNLTPGVTSYGWRNTNVVAPEGYDIYMSNNYHVSNSQAVCKLTFHDCSECDIYIRSYGESSFDYTMASTVNATTFPTGVSSSYVLAYTQSHPQSGTTLAYYTKVSYTGLHDGDYVYIVYVKDGSTDSGDDRGYVLIPKKGIGGSSANVWKSITATPKTYTINFYDSGDGTVDVSTPIGTVEKNYQATLTAPSASGYVSIDSDVADMYEEFLGWTDVPWDGVSQNVISTLKCTGNMNLYAVYKNAYVGTRALIERNVTGDLQCSATSVGEYAFSDLDGLEYIDLTSATSIGAHAFENDANLVMVDIRTSACDIDPTAFDGCYSLEEIRVPVGSLSYYQTELGSLGVTITEHAWSDFEPNGWLGGTVEDVSGLPTPSYR